MRTPALWGLRLRRPLLHDGSALTIDEAIRRHGGVAKAAIERYVKADAKERKTLLHFLQSL
ncbi:MAG: di-heme oxidoredictase family protein [Acidobacteriota bacterium]